ncbi:hypothetical protein KBZ20_10495 [Vulcanococcus limneticus Candia 3F8]|uniref:hypothetical protein n=1 Tax=Vulcanococcus limneticus TaxID=2170428 RepID=UPI0012FFA7D4|nr:hypothetical protein [Vulcanococcus limneticus]MCP9894200.1 hypothetical protein [Vulcanococcus limneticus Candia 3F8]MCP9897961.1 hypothetical protein [Vulcanococcus limneticus Candia 3B3]
MATDPSPSPPPLACERDLPALRHVDGAAILLLLLGCLTGLVLLIRRGDEVPRPQATAPAQQPWDSREDLRQRIGELEQRLLDTVPRSIEQKYGDL